MAVHEPAERPSRVAEHRDHIQKARPKASPGCEFPEEVVFDFSHSEPRTTLVIETRAAYLRALRNSAIALASSSPTPDMALL